jgi:hypothetical protein
VISLFHISWLLFLLHTSYKWVVPFTYKFKDSSKSDLAWLNLTDGSVQMPANKDPNDWILGNIDFMGYYRVNYDRNNWLSLIKQLKANHLVFSTTERAALISDSFTFAR